ncbi:hypothetical protein MXD95_013490 [Frankia sp. AiPa1]|nr:hypothetical protein [Frankia sp. AiPa1]MCL9760226.1 hypothetical protein [Frankia sp. AiPa1]
MPPTGIADANDAEANDGETDATDIDQIPNRAPSAGRTATGLLDLSPDELLSTTRMVRLRLDLTRPVPRTLLDQCVQLAVQAPTGRNRIAFTLDSGRHDQ